MLVSASISRSRFSPQTQGSTVPGCQGLRVTGKTVSSGQVRIDFFRLVTSLLRNATELTSRRLAVAVIGEKSPKLLIWLTRSGSSRVRFLFSKWHVASGQCRPSMPVDILLCHRDETILAQISDVRNSIFQSYFSQNQKPNYSAIKLNSLVFIWTNTSEFTSWYANYL